MPENERVSPIYLVAWCAFLLIPAFAFYKGWQHHSALAMIVSSVAILGFVTLIVLTLRHNRKVSRQVKR
jgi:hypothetical protein